MTRASMAANNHIVCLITGHKYISWFRTNPLLFGSQPCPPLPPTPKCRRCAIVTSFNYVCNAHQALLGDRQPMVRGYRLKWATFSETRISTGNILRFIHHNRKTERNSVFMGMTEEPLNVVQTTDRVIGVISDFQTGEGREKMFQ